jgi:putative glutamine amidotransferase
MTNIPLIGVSGSLEHDESRQMIARDYFTSIAASGGIPVLLSVDMSEEQVDACLQKLDGLLLAGGADVDPRLYGEMPLPSLAEVDPLRDQLEMALLKASNVRQLPVLGICRGAQVMNVIRGGTLYQDLQSQYALDHSRPANLHSQTAPSKYPSHEILLEGGSRLSELLSLAPCWVNSLHHQAVRKLAPGLRAAAFSPDGVTEAIEDPAHPFWIGVQWHPERMYQSDAQARALFDAFVEAAMRYAAEKS